MSRGEMVDRNFAVTKFMDSPKHTSPIIIILNMFCLRRKRSDSWDPNSPRVSSLEIDMDYDRLDKLKQKKRAPLMKRIYALQGIRVW